MAGEQVVNGKTFGKHAGSARVSAGQSNVSSNQKARESASFCDLERKTPPNSVKHLAAAGKHLDPTNAQIIAEMNRAKVAFQLATICAVMGIKEQST